MPHRPFYELLVVAIAFAPSLVLLAEEKPAAAAESTETTTAETPAGHSYHGEAFNEGPRQKAYLMGGTGDVRFPVTTENEQVQKLIEQGVGQLYGFWYLEAERSFRQAAAIEPECAMAYWGAAMANKSNDKRGKGFIAEAVKRKDKVSERERMYIDALDKYIQADAKKKKERGEAFTTALDDISLKFPEDLEAKAFLALELYNGRSNGGIKSYQAVESLMQQIFKQNPKHPAHHFRIHLWDYKKAEKALDSAATCGSAAPSIAHMWHMPGHIYSKLKRYHDAAWQQEASARVDHANMMHDGVLPDQIHNFAHNNEWLIRNLVHVGRADDAVDLAKNMTELPRHPKYNTLAKRGSAYYGRLRLIETLWKFERWDDLIALADTPYLEPTDDEGEQIKRLRYLGTAYYQTGNIDAGNEQLALLEARLPKEGTEKKDEPKKDEGEKKDEADKSDKAPEAKTDEGDEVKPPAPIEVDAAKPAEPPKEEAAESAGDGASAAVSKKNKPNLDKAINALKGYAAVAAGDAKAGTELLKKAGEDKLIVARLRAINGEAAQVVSEVQSFANSNANEVRPKAFLAEVLWLADKKEEAKKAFADLQKMSSDIDLGAPIFERLKPIAAEMQLPEDWRVARTIPADFGERPTLDSLGPFRWRPSPAADWSLKDASGTSLSLKHFQGKPVVLIFYLGYGCLHCVEQLHAFGPRVKDFKAAGLDVVAIGTDDADSLSKALTDYTGEPFEMPLLSDADLTTFKKYRAFDDFEDQPLHGTFIIDGAGFIRWQDISYEPFNDVDFVLNEAKRLLAQEPVKAE